MSSVDDSVEEKLARARLLPRLSQDVLSLATSCDKLLKAQHSSNLTEAILCVQELAREHYMVVVALKWVVILVDLLESDMPDVRVAACNALSAVSVAQEGRDAIRSSGGLRPLVMLLAEGSRSAMAAGAALALMNCSACDTCKEAITGCRGVPQLLALLRDVAGRCSPSAPSPRLDSDGVPSPSGGGPQDLRSPGDCRAAVYAAGALMNMGGVASVQEAMLEAGAITVFEELLRAAVPGDAVATRANFVLTWLAVGTHGFDAEPEEAPKAPPPAAPRSPGAAATFTPHTAVPPAVAAAAAAASLQRASANGMRSRPASGRSGPPPQPQPGSRQSTQTGLRQSTPPLPASASAAARAAAGSPARQGSPAPASKPGTPASTSARTSVPGHAR